MKFFSALALTFALALGVTTMDAEAKRLGSGKSVGMQRDATPARTPDATPSQTPGAPASAAAPAAGAAGTAAAASGRSWMGPLAGIAAGLGIAALASYLGFGEELATLLMLGLLVVAVLAVVGFVMRKRAASAQGASPAYAGAAHTRQTADFSTPQSAPMARTGVEPGTAAAPTVQRGGGSLIGANLAGGQSGGSPAIPADFDAAAFVRNAKVQFIRLQAANDAGNLDDIREFTTPEMFAEIKMDIDERAGAAQTTEVKHLDAEVVQVVEEAQRYVVTVRFGGVVREDGLEEGIAELWHLTKPRQGAGGWVLAGIQQLG